MAGQEPRELWVDGLSQRPPRVWRRQAGYPQRWSWRIPASSHRKLEAARFTADPAFRQYDAADPANRLVAAELEARWNAALAGVADVEAKIAEHDAVAPPCEELSLASFARLAVDLEALWAAPTTDVQLKKRIVRTVIREVVADIDQDVSEIVLTVHWAGGVHTEQCLPKRRRGQRNSTAPDIIDAVRLLVRIAGDDLIAGLLNRKGLVTGDGNRCTRERVTSLRSHHRIRVHRPAADGIEPWLNLTRAAALLQVTPKTLRRAVENGEIEASIRSPTVRGSSAGRFSKAKPEKPSRAGRITARTPHGTASRSAKPLPFNGIERWVLQCRVVVDAPVLDDAPGRGRRFDCFFVVGVGSGICPDVGE